MYGRLTVAWFVAILTTTLIFLFSPLIMASPAQNTNTTPSETTEIIETPYDDPSDFRGLNYDNSTPVNSRGKPALFLDTPLFDSSDDEADEYDKQFIDPSPEHSHEPSDLGFAVGTVNYCHHVATVIDKIEAHVTHHPVGRHIILSTALPDVQVPLRWPKNPRAAIQQFAIKPLGRGHRDRTRSRARKVQGAIRLQKQKRLAYLKRKDAR